MEQVTLGKSEVLERIEEITDVILDEKNSEDLAPTKWVNACVLAQGQQQLSSAS